MSDDTTSDGDPLSGDEAAAFLTSTEHVSGTVDVAGREIELTVREVDLAEVREIDQAMQAGERTEQDIINEYLVEPDVNVDNLGIAKRHDLYVGINRVWMGGDVYDAAEAAMELPDEGNG